MNAEALVNTMAKTLHDGNAKTFLDTLSDIKPETLVATLADTLEEAEAELPADISRYLETDTLLRCSKNPSIGKSSDTWQQTLQC